MFKSYMYVLIILMHLEQSYGITPRNQTILKILWQLLTTEFLICVKNPVSGLKIFH